MTALPTLDDRRIDEIEDALFAEIARDRETQASTDAATAARRRRRRRWTIGSTGAAAAVLVVAIAIAPQMPALTGTAGTAGEAASTSGDAVTTTEGSAELFGAEAPAMGVPEADAAAGGEERADSPATTAEAGQPDRQVIATANATVVVDDPRAAAERIAADAEAAGGFVQTLSAGGGESADGGAAAPDTAMWPPAVPGDAWVSVRVPATSLTSMLAGLASLGEVEESRVARDDVTAQSVDLQARIDAGRVSVERLTALLAQAGTVADLVAAESALAERQADLESLEQQLAALDEQVALSTLTVELRAPSPSVNADPAGFADGWSAGWNGLIATANGVIVALGFLLPWIALLAAAGAVVWGVVRGIRRLRTRRAAAGADVEPGR